MNIDIRFFRRFFFNCSFFLHFRNIFAFCRLHSPGKVHLRSMPLSAAEFSSFSSENIVLSGFHFRPKYGMIDSGACQITAINPIHEEKP